MSATITLHMTPDEILVTLACLDGVSVDDHSERQKDLFVRLSKTLQRHDPDTYERVTREMRAFQHWEDFLIDRAETKVTYASVSEMPFEKRFEIARILLG